MINQQFRLLFAGQAVSVVGDALFPVALAFAVLDDLNGTPAQLGLVLAAQTVPMAVLILASGVWADRLNRRNVMIISDLGPCRRSRRRWPILLISGTAELWHLVVLVAIYGDVRGRVRPRCRRSRAGCRRPRAPPASERDARPGAATPAWSSARRWPAC